MRWILTIWLALLSTAMLAQSPYSPKYISVGLDNFTYEGDYIGDFNHGIRIQYSDTIETSFDYRAGIAAGNITGRKPWGDFKTEYTEISFGLDWTKNLTKSKPFIGIGSSVLFTQTKNQSYEQTLHCCSPAIYGSTGLRATCLSNYVDLYFELRSTIPFGPDRDKVLDGHDDRTNSECNHHNTDVLFNVIIGIAINLY